MKLVRGAAAALTAVLLVAGCSSSQDSQDDSSVDEVQAYRIAPLARFTPHISALKTPLEAPGTVDEMASKLLASGRPASFSLQAICRLYSDMDPKFKEMRDDFKGLEDGIGQYAKWEEIYQGAVAAKKDAATLARLKQEKEVALAAFVKLLTDKNWKNDGKTPTRMQEHEAFLNAFKWKSRAVDRGLMLEALSDEMKDLKKTEYDMTILEHGDGVHELRRDLRWVAIEQLALNGMIVLDETKACPIPAYAELPMGDRYTMLRSTTVEKSPCKISACLVAAVAKNVNALGDLKDQAEIQVNINGEADVVPEALQPQTKALYADLVKNDLFGVYKAELDACKDAL